MCNFILIEQCEISFSEGLQICTGETGAGKSLIVDALSLLAGGRATGQWVRTGAEAASLSARIMMTKLPALCEDLHHNNLVAETQKDQVILQRSFSTTGRSRCRVNGHLVSLATLRRLGSYWLDLCTQDVAWALLTPEQQRAWLDEFGGERLQQARQQYHTAYGNWLAWLKKPTPSAPAEVTQQQAFLTDQLREVMAVDPQPDEDVHQAQEHAHLLQEQHRQQGIATAYTALHGEGRGLDSLREALFSLQEVGATDPLMEEFAHILEQTEEIARTVARWYASSDTVEDALQQVEERLQQIQRLIQQYGGSLAVVLKKRQEWEESLQSLEEVAAARAQWEEDGIAVQDRLLKTAIQLTEVRRQVAEELQAMVEGELREMAIPAAQFVIEVAEKFEGKTKQRFGPHGQDRVTFLWAANPGESLAPLTRTASGGERTRVVLALKTALAPSHLLPTMVFDEVDTGISGRAAQAVAERLALLAQHAQVISVTHLPQVASMADRHHCVTKCQTGERVTTVISSLDVEGRKRELARLVGGTEITSTTCAHAAELLRLAAQYKEQLG